MDPNRLPFMRSQSVGRPPTVSADIRYIALWQKKFVLYVLLGLLGQAALVLMVFAVAKHVPVILPIVTGFGIISWLLLAIPILIAAFRLCSRLYGTAIACLVLLLCLFALFPLGLIALVIANSKATRILRESGINVGFFGANFSQLPLATSKAQK